MKEMNKKQEFDENRGDRFSENRFCHLCGKKLRTRLGYWTVCFYDTSTGKLVIRAICRKCSKGEKAIKNNNVMLETNNPEIRIILDSCGELLAQIEDKTARGFDNEIIYLKSFIAKIRDNGDVDSILREYAKEILEGEN
jgi:hypothetical protein